MDDIVTCTFEMIIRRSQYWLRCSRCWRRRLNFFVPLVMAAVIDVGIAQKDRPYIVKMCFVLIALGIIGLVCSITAQ